MDEDIVVELWETAADIRARAQEHRHRAQALRRRSEELLAQFSRRRTVREGQQPPDAPLAPAARSASLRDH